MPSGYHQRNRVRPQSSNERALSAGRRTHTHQRNWYRRQVQWDSRARALSITEKELIPIILTLTGWGGAWTDRQNICYCNNQAVVTCLKSRTSKCKGVMHLFRCLLFIEVRKRCYLHPIYIDTHYNYLADALSHNNLPLFLSKCPDADPHPIPISLTLLSLLLNPSVDWTSPRRSHQFNTTFRVD